ADQPRLESRGADGRRAPLSADLAPARVLRVRHAGGRLRLRGGRPASRPVAARRAGQGEPHPVQRLAGCGVPPAAAAADPRVPGRAPRRRRHDDGALEQGRGHRRRLRPAQGARRRVRTIAFATLGCRLNQVDTQQMQALLEARGFRAVPLEATPDVVVVNTCTVTARAELSDRRAIRRAARLSRGGRVVVTGCWAQTNGAEVAALGGVDLVVGNADKARLPDLLAGLTRSSVPRVEVSDIAGARIEPLAAPAKSERARAFLKVQDGCQHRCAFCVVPLARGASRSLAPAAIEAHARALVDAGHVEIVLTGVDLGHYGADLVPRTSLAALLARLVTISGLRWLRLSSLLPAYFTGELLDIVTGSPVIAPHLHVPLQSGSDRVLRAM